jgi:sodium/hydrogen antiporter
MYVNLAVIACFAFIYSVTSGGFSRTPFNGAIIFTLFGLTAGPLGLGVLQLDIEGEYIRALAEVTLALVLFGDAANADLRVLRKSYRIPERLLLIGLPLTIVLGVLCGLPFFPGFGLLELLILAVILTPTDAALGAAVVTDQRVPAQVREGLNIESGLNDGLCVPVLLTLLAMAMDVDGSEAPLRLALRYVLEEIGIGLVVGCLLSLAGAGLLKLGVRLGWVNRVWRQLPVIALALSCFSLAQAWGGSGFIAAFSGGLLFGALGKPHKQEYLVAAEATGDGLSLLTWVLFGATVISDALASFSWHTVLYALCSLTVVRMVPVYLVLAGTRLGHGEKLFISWFGPRGLASVVFVVMVANAALPHAKTIIMTAVCSITLSVLLHGLSAHPLVHLLARRNK